LNFLKKLLDLFENMEFYLFFTMGELLKQKIDVNDQSLVDYKYDDTLYYGGGNNFDNALKFIQNLFINLFKNSNHSFHSHVLMDTTKDIDSLLNFIFI
jgi:hypothetical protein